MTTSAAADAAVKAAVDANTRMKELETERDRLVPIRRDAIMKLHQEGYRVSEIARLLGLEHPTISNILRRMRDCS